MASDTIAIFNYLLAPPDGSRPYNRVYADSATGKPARNWVEDPHDMPVEDVRGKEELYKLDNAGFQYGREASKFTSFLNDDEIEREYYPESIDLIRRVTGATKIVIFDHTIRRRRPGEWITLTRRNVNPSPGFAQTQTPAASIGRVHRHLPPTEAPSLLRRRFQIINLWRPISHAAKDFVPVAHIYPDREGETFGVKYNPNHQWKYMKAMTPEEYVLIKCSDSIQDGSTPNTPEGTPPRESIELRALVFYD
ncbi:hypothetical protein DFJ58DRAFT_813402 [Suillus subalutaceus]|uniref:uncharacterized protein n=1 Tax=Suillus subalutaceus TaxID=48586 RepID=UPI001B871E88|nr:uncharacterized protein DFJ58DRAFT_813402 [Suillus subalutaceus]KAG1838721.1 hypothetical protein DFJ58DRAFT_813402 [Suillus subalutaceus]